MKQNSCCGLSTFNGFTVVTPLHSQLSRMLGHFPMEITSIRTLKTFNHSFRLNPTLAAWPAQALCDPVSVYTPQISSSTTFPSLSPQAILLSLLQTCQVHSPLQHCTSPFPSDQCIAHFLTSLRKLSFQKITMVPRRFT